MLLRLFRHILNHQIYNVISYKCKDRRPRT